jgi:hypothetical protein
MRLGADAHHRHEAASSENCFMKHLVTLILLLSASAASAAEMPKELRGNWCFAQPVADGRYVRCKSGDDLIIEQKTISWKSCTPLRIRKSKRTPDTWIVKAHCPASDSTLERTETTRYTRRGAYLHVK